MELLGHVDALLLNDGEARQLTEQSNLVKAARWIIDRGPRIVIIKKGEHGAFMFTSNSVFFAPAYPLEDVFDPTGAGDAFAGGFMGYLARTGKLDEEHMRRAVVYGSTMGSFAVEQFSIDRLMTIDHEMARARRVPPLVAFEEELPAWCTECGAGLSYRSAGVDIDAADDAWTRIGRLVESARTAGCIGEFGAFGGCFAPRRLGARSSWPAPTVSARRSR
jgi:hypothetical protein